MHTGQLCMQCMQSCPVCSHFQCRKPECQMQVTQMPNWLRTRLYTALTLWIATSCMIVEGWHYYRLPVVTWSSRQIVLSNPKLTLILILTHTLNPVISWPLCTTSLWLIDCVTSWLAPLLYRIHNANPNPDFTKFTILISNRSTVDHEKHLLWMHTQFLKVCFIFVSVFPLLVIKCLSKHIKPVCTWATSSLLSFSIENYSHFHFYT